MNDIRNQHPSSPRPAGRAALVVVAILLAISSCTAAEPDNPGTERLSVVATTSILGDLSRHVVGDAADVTTLIPIGTDPHEYQASSQQAAMLREADVVIANGLGLESGLGDVLEAAEADGALVFEIGPRVDPVPFDDPAAAGDDPHVWLDPIRMASAAEALAAELESVSPGGGWGERAEAYGADLLAAHKDIVAMLEAVPNERRIIVTNHDALGYFARRYGFEVVGVVIPGGSPLASPSSADLAALAAAIERREVPAIFAETTEPRLLAEAVADELDREVIVIELYTGSLGETGSGADTLIGLLLTDAELIAGALS